MAAPGKHGQNGPARGAHAVQQQRNRFCPHRLYDNFDPFARVHFPVSP